MYKRTLVFLLSYTYLFCSPLIGAEEKHAARLVVHLLDYLAKDYPGAVGEDSSLLSASEFDEQVEFADTALKASLDIRELRSREDIKDGLTELDLAIRAKAPPSRVTVLARTMQSKVLEASQLSVSPTMWPSLNKGARLFADNCAVCHGASGAGNGPGGVALDPKPANFLSHESMDGAAPLGEFNTIRLGVQGTGMAPFANLSDDETWSLAFYVVSLRHQKPSEDIKLDFDDELLRQAATLSDIKLAKVLNVDLADKNSKLSAVRLHQVNADRINTLALARTYLADTEKAYNAGDQAGAKSHALKSYLEGVEPVEPRLKAQAPELVTQIEVTMGEVRSAIEKSSPAAELHNKIEKARVAIDAADANLKSRGIDNRVAFIYASGILLREGFEAALIILSLLSVIRALGARRAAIWVHAGWILALASGVACWFLAGVLFDISGAQREMLEGTTSLIAVLVLIVLGFWLHRHSEIGRWTRFIKGKVQAAIDSKNLLGLATISFLAVFREAFESVLFLRVLWFEADDSAKNAMMTGTGLTLIFIIVASWMAVSFSARLPINKLFRISSYIMAALAFILTGKGIHSLQESGMISINNIMPFLRWELMGVFPSKETLLAQFLVLALIGVLWMQGRKASAA